MEWSDKDGTIKKIIGGFIAGFLSNKALKSISNTSDEKEQIAFFNKIINTLSANEKEKLYDFITNLKNKYNFQEFRNKLTIVPVK